ncbi:transmembrane protein 64-like [Senna tora]|uniref:Transmembrane protein 64-like n=1 Tax=Senna tora TaxID=362788 RepID=A0A834SWU4_9FABA|nr:transmembrane protein 64-like [Senna tora]
MNPQAEDDGGREKLVPELSLQIRDQDNDNDDDDEVEGYVKLRPEPRDSESEINGLGEDEAAAAAAMRLRRRCSVWYWVKLALFLACLGLLALVFLMWVGPLLMDKEVIPLLNWGESQFSTGELAVMIFASVALFPTLLLPSSPSMWVAGMTFGYGLGFLLIISAVSVGVSLPFFIGSIFHHKIQVFALIRISPFPYILYNYCAVATNVKYGPYIMGSLIGVVPEIFVAIYTYAFSPSL